MEKIEPAAASMEDSDDNDNANTPSAVAAAAQKKLSGATMNMRFMQRKKQVQAINNTNNSSSVSAIRREQHASRYQSPAASHSSLADKMNTSDSMDLDGQQQQQEEAPAISPMLQHSPAHLLLFQQQHQTADRIPIDTTPATTSDMYGLAVQVVGRRSFGGFNRNTELTWKASYKSHQQGSSNSEPNNNNNNKQQKISDEELLARYANLVKSRNDKDNTRTPVGNLKQKVRPRKSMSSEKSSSGKRKR